MPLCVQRHVLKMPVFRALQAGSNRCRQAVMAVASERTTRLISEGVSVSAFAKSKRDVQVIIPPIQRLTLPLGFYKL